ncbi:hypothetical protein [Selenomonas bovis]|uniref:hypothetical protein n=1 Tax=Selenomonas bovis TaxID=416586 RepID=UPI0003AAD8DC|nr:hypothetical protein [Selenomonas bovis]
MERRYQQGIYEADACRCELSSLPDDAARICFLKRHRRKLLTSLHEAQKRLSCIDYMLYELEQKQKECGADET